MLHSELFRDLQQMCCSIVKIAATGCKNVTDDSGATMEFTEYGVCNMYVDDEWVHDVASSTCESCNLPLTGFALCTLLL